MAGDGSTFMSLLDTTKTMLPMAGPGGAVAAAAIGLGEGIYGAVQANKAKKSRPPLYDAMQVSAMQDLNRRANNAYTGTAFAEGMRTADQEKASGLKALSRGGNINQYGLLSRIASDTYNKTLAQGQQTEMAYRQSALQELNDIAQRKLALDSQRYAELRAQSQGMIKSGAENLMMGGAGMLGNNNTGVDIAGNQVMPAQAGGTGSTLFSGLFRKNPNSGSMIANPNANAVPSNEMQLQGNSGLGSLLKLYPEG
jgi:hypothetical protein